MTSSAQAQARPFLDIRLFVRSVKRQYREVLLEWGALIIGLTLIAVMASVVDALLRPAVTSDRVVGITSIGQTRASGFEAVSYPNYQDIAARKTTFEKAAAFARITSVLSTGHATRIAVGEGVTPEYFELFGVRAAVGRLLVWGETGREHAFTGQREIVLSHNAWTRMFGGRKEIVGTPVKLGQATYTIVGVMPEGFTGFFRGVIPDFWLQLGAHAEQVPSFRATLVDRRNAEVWVVGKLTPGTTLARASAEIRNLSGLLAQEYPDSNGGIQFSLVEARRMPFHPALGQQLVTALSIMLFAPIALIFLLTASNVTNLASQRSCTRVREMALRISLGAGRGRILRQLMVENTIVTMAAAIVALALAWWTTALLSNVRLPLQVQAGLSMTLNTNVMLITLGAAVSIGLCVSAAMVLGMWSILTGDGFRSVGRAQLWAGRRSVRIRKVLIAGQIAVSMTLVGVSALAVRSLAVAKSIDLGFEPNDVTVVSLSPGLAGYDIERASLVVGKILADVKALPIVESASLVQPVPLSLNVRLTRLRTEHTAHVRRSQLPLVQTAVVGPSYFNTLRIPFLAGRDFTITDDASNPRVTIINQAMAAQLWPKESPLGKTLAIGFPEPATATVVGVVADSKNRSLGSTVEPMAYTAFTQERAAAAATILVVRSRSDSRELARGLTGVASRVDPNLPLHGIETMRQRMAIVYELPSYALKLFGFCAVMACAFAGLGVYGLISSSVTSRAKEFGIRVALGATPSIIFNSAIGNALTLTAIGIVLGGGGLFLTSSALRATLPGTDTIDPLAVIGSMLLVALICCAASWTPARRASVTNPVVGLRYE